MQKMQQFVITPSGKHLGLNVNSDEQFHSFNEAIRGMKVKSNATSSNFKSVSSISRTHCFRSQCHLWDMECSEFFFYRDVLVEIL